MISRAFFTLEYEGQTFPNLYAEIKQPVGSDFETTPLEISRPSGYDGPFNYEAFRAVLEMYYRSLVGRTGSGIHIQGGGNIRMRDNTFIQHTIAEFEVSTSNTGW
jgi:hypothetical protein